MNAFITGSHAYGKPNKESDIDLVIRADYDVKRLLTKAGGVTVPGKKDVRGNDYVTIRFGPLNIVVCETDNSYAIWKIGTEALRERKEETGKSITKEEALKQFNELRELTSTQDDY